MLTCLCDLYPIASYFYIAKLEFTGVYVYIYAPNFEKVGSILLSARPCVRPSDRPSVQKRINARVLKFHIWIPRQK